MKSSELGAQVWTEVGSPLVVIPVGSFEQHGPHLPLDTDTRIANAVASGLATARDDVVIGPSFTVTASGEHAGFPGTLSIGTEVMESALIELVRSADWAGGIVFVNGHGGNITPVESATRRLRREGRRAMSWWPMILGGDAHAGRTETSLMLAIDPSLVRLDAAEAGSSESLAELMPQLREVGVRGVSANGVLGDPAGASAEEGQALLDRLVDDLVLRVAAWA